MDQQMNKLEVELSNLMHQWGIPERPEGLRPHAETLRDGAKIKYRLRVPLGSNILPENVKVCVSESDNKVRIETRKEELYDHGNSRLYQEISRQFKLPKAVDVPELKSVLNPNGDLVIEAPLVEKDGAFKEPVPVPVKFESHL
jgi:HSP20 family molecular chaperone IbpA